MKKLYTIVICIGLATNVSDLNATAYFDWNKAKQAFEAVKLSCVFAKFFVLYCVIGRDKSLRLAAQLGDQEAVRLSLLSGANVNASVHNDGATALMAAANSGHLEVVWLLLQAGANVNAANNNNGYTALMYAAHKGYRKVAELLLQAGAGINTANNHGATALIFAADIGHHEVVELLLLSEANVNAATHNHGTTALMVAANSGHQGVAELLLQAGANVNAVAHDGRTAIDFAFDNPGIRQLLERYGRFKFIKASQQFDNEPKPEDYIEDIVIPAGTAADVVFRTLELHDEGYDRQIDAFMQDHATYLHNKVQNAYEPFAFQNNLVPLRNLITQDMYTKIGLLPEVMSFFNSRTDFLAVQNELKQGATKRELERLQIVERFVNRK